MIVMPTHPAALAKLDALRTELADLAFELERQGRCDAADVTNMLGVRLAEVAGELAAGGPELTRR